MKTIEEVLAKSTIVKSVEEIDGLIRFLRVAEAVADDIDGYFSIYYSRGNWSLEDSSYDGSIEETLFDAISEFIYSRVQFDPIDYYEYIQSDKWKEKSEAAKRRAGYRCQLCNRSKDEITLHTHHRTYERLGHELPEDLTVLCSVCHALFHQK